MNAYDENELEPTVERAVRVLKTEPVPDGPPPPVVATVLAAGAAETLNKHRSLRERITSMNRIAKVAAAFAAAAVIIAATVVAFLVLPGGRGGTLALADMLKPITAKTAKFTITVRMESQPAGMPPERTRQMLVMENLIRQELPGGVYKVMDLKSSRCVTIIPRQKKVLVTKMPGLAQVAKDQMSDDFFGELRRRVEELRGSGPKDVEFLPDKTIGGRPARGFHKHLEGIDITVWADAETCLPVLMEIRYGSAPQQYFVTMSNFELDVPLDPALFSTAIPEGYTVEDSTSVFL